MAQIVVTIKIMPESPDVDLKKLEQKATQEITNFGGDVGKVDIEPIAFGLKSVNLIFVMDEKLGNLDPLEEKINNIEGVQNAEVSDVRRAIG
ncbi:MAG: elongation factor 1-beta [Candidatus Nanoarchaeia archaeon]|nr:elongation factor 1-beta [Candidatus Nanoarchaeia archaeon]